MELFVLKSEAETKFIMVLVFWGIRWLYSHLNGSNDVVSNEEPDQDEVEDQAGIKEYPPITTLPSTRKRQIKRLKLRLYSRAQQQISPPPNPLLAP